MIICLEGLPRTGKTTIYEQHRSLNKIPEQYEFLEQILKPATNLKEFAENQEVFIKIESERKRKVRKHNLVDRSILSNLSFAYAVDKTSIKGAYKKSLKLHKKYLNKSNTIIPTTYIWINNKNFDEIRGRIRKNESFDAFWLETNFLESIHEFYQNYFENTCTTNVLTYNCLDEFLKNPPIYNLNKQEADQGLKRFIK